ncbi:type VI secretion system-associated FHA domain protein TagH [Bradyrhizobium sp.]|uniref:type VI secretion system-associated FHA domain protein TagH n=1 Tax=Bradyrhizobium sp. TaxID=376 RepID=UPI001ECFB79A|nr:type VI secretion system-associated FHA domain protein TagH [Bradyrhizobium sp.]MBV9985905.1 type VI secretion system-associated FHA domain protein TagH [Bradyrhizobium sp.]
MALTLTIENETSLPDGGPLSVSIKGKRGLDIGRDPYLDWTLPDPSRFISGRHCEVRWYDGAYWLHDISTNGTFMNGADGRLKAPHRLRNGDRFIIGHYVIAAAIEEAAEPGVAAPPALTRDEDLWTAGPDAVDPVEPRQLKGPLDAVPVGPDFLDWAADVPIPTTPRAPHAGGQSHPLQEPHAAFVREHDSWAEGPPPQPPAPPAVLPVPTPRRPEAPPYTVPATAPATVPQAGAGAEATTNLVQLVARGAGLPEDAFAGRDPAELAEQLGRLLKLATDNARQLLEARQQAKRLARSPNQTTVQAVNNNPLKFAPTAEDAIRLMFSVQSPGYLDAEQAFAQCFDDLKKHQISTYTAMQQAVALLMTDVDPTAIETASGSERGLAGIVGSRKARLWDIYVARWQAIARRTDNGALDTFMDYFARCYESR